LAEVDDKLKMAIVVTVVEEQDRLQNRTHDSKMLEIEDKQCKVSFV
jgi:hypothetical protein